MKLRKELFLYIDPLKQGLKHKENNQQNQEFICGMRRFNPCFNGSMYKNF